MKRSHNQVRAIKSLFRSRLGLEFLEDRSVPAVLTVNPAGGAMFTTIAGAVAASADGDTIQLANGTYVESNVAVNHAVTIQGQSRAGVIIEPAAADSHDDSSFGGTSQYAFIVQHDNVTITNLTIDGNANTSLIGNHNYRGGIITDFQTLPDDWDNLAVQNVTIQHVYRRGIQISDVSTGHLISGNTISDVALASENGIGILSFGGDGSFLNNTITQAFTGIATNFADTVNGAGPVQATIQGNSVTVNNGGIALDLFGLVGGSTVSGNTLNLTTDTGANVGILLGDTRAGAATVSNNTITASGADSGIWVSEASSANQPTISGNKLTATSSAAGTPGQGIGIFLTDDNSITSTANGDTFATLNNNTITGFNTGIDLLDSTTGGAASTQVSATIDNTTVSGGANGIVGVGGVGDLTLNNVTVSGNTANGINVAGAAPATLTLNKVSITSNAGTGLTVSGFTTDTITDLTLTGGTNTNSISTPSGGTINFTPSTTQAVTVTASGGSLQDSVGGTANDSISLSGESKLNLTGSSAADTFNITPPAAGTPAINVVAGPPNSTTGAPGDTLNFTSTTGLNVTSSFTAGSGFSGSASVSGQPAVTFSGIESFANGSTISGTVFNDANGNGTKDNGEGGLAGVTVQLDIGANGTFEETTTTDAQGHYSFTGLPPGNYRVRVIASNGQTVTTAPPADISATLGSTSSNVNFGLHGTGSGSTGASTVTGIVFNDINKNSVQESGEVGLNGLTVFLDLNGNGNLDSNEPSTVTSSINGVPGSFTLTSTTVGVSSGIRVVEKPGFLQNTSNANVFLTDGQTETVNLGVSANVPPQATPSRLLAVGVVEGNSAKVEVFDGAGHQLYSIPLAGTFAGGIRVAMADVTGDGVEDVIVGTGPGTVATVTVFAGNSHNAIFSTAPFESTFADGVFVAVGDVNRDGIADIIITPDQGGGPRVVAVSGGSFQTILSFFGIADPNFRGGARASVGDVNGDGTPDILVAAGFGGGPRISIFDGVALANGQFTNVVNDFFVFEQTLRNGVFIASGDADGDGFADLTFGGGPGGGPRVLVLSGQVLVKQGIGTALAAPLANFFAGNVNNRNGVHVAMKDFDADGRADLATGDGNSGHVTAYFGVTNTERFHEDVDSTTGGVFVG